jgi:HK97 family phage major capsid protein
MSQIIDDLAVRRDGLLKNATQIAQKGVTENRDLSVEEQTSFDQYLAESDGIGKRMTAIHEGEQRAKDIEISFRGSSKDVSSTGEGVFGKWARESRMGDAFDLQREFGAEQRAVANRGRTFETRAMSATLGAGPSSVYSQLYEYAVATSQVLQAGVMIINTADGNTLPMPKVTVHATGASAAANAAITATDATLATTDLSVTKDGYLTLVPNELLSDATFDVEGYLARAAGRELGRKIGQKAVAAITAGFTVTGVTGPTGAASGTLGAQASAGQGADLLIDLFHSVLPEYRTNSSWLMGDGTAGLVRRLKDSLGQYVWERSLQVGDPALIEGRPIYIDPFLPVYTGVPATDSTKKIIYFGDFSALAVRIAGGVRFERSSESGFANDQTAFRAIVRSGAVALDPNAVKFLILS